MLYINHDSKKTNMFTVVSVILITSLLIINQLTIEYLNKAQVHFLEVMKNYSSLQDVIIYRQKILAAQVYRIDSEKKLIIAAEEINKEIDNDIEKRIIANVIESVYPGIRKQYTVQKANKSVDRKKDKSWHPERDQRAKD